MNNFRTHWAIMPPAQAVLWPLLRPAVELGFVLYGGTAVALRLGHRRSIDFDFFTERSLNKAAIKEKFPFIEHSMTLRETGNSWSLLASGDTPGERPVQISFFGGIATGRVGIPQFTDDGGVLVASLQDLMAFKMKVILQRVEAKDYQDIAVMLRAGASLDHALASARALFGNEFQPMESLKALTYFEGGDLKELSSEDRDSIVAATRRRTRLDIIELTSTKLGLE